MAADNNSRKTTPGTTGSGTIKLKKSKSKLSDATVSRANSPTSSIAGDSITVKSRAFSPDTSVVSAANDETNTLCKHCKHRYDKTTDPNHSKLCLRAKQERQRKKKEEKERAERAAAGEDIKQEDAGTPAPGDVSLLDSTSKNKKDKTVSAAGDKKQTKKRKATDDTASLAGDSTTMKPPTKKQKKKDAAANTAASVADTASLRGTPAPTTKDSTSAANTSTAASTTNTKTKPSTAKPKAPVDVERQCGVPLPNGQLCARSLTCKSHAMGAKRAVPGRSLPYDILLAQYQKKNQAKLQKAAMERNAAEERDALGEGEEGRVDSEEEVERVMGGLARWAPRPVEGFGVHWGSGWGGVGRRTREVRFREMLGDALKGNRGAGLFAVGNRGQQGQGQAQQNIGGVDAGGAVTMDGLDALPSSDAALGNLEMDRRMSMASRKGSAVAG